MCHLQTKSSVATAWRAPVEISVCGLLRISAKTVWKRLYGAQVKRICASTLAMELRFADWAKNSRIKAITAIVAGDEIHPIGDYDLFQVTPVTTRHRRL